MGLLFLSISRNEKGSIVVWVTDSRTKEAAQRAVTSAHVPPHALLRFSDHWHAGKVASKLGGTQRSAPLRLGQPQPEPVRRRGKVVLRKESLYTFRGGGGGGGGGRGPGERDVREGLERRKEEGVGIQERVTQSYSSGIQASSVSQILA